MNHPSSGRIRPTRVLARLGKLVLAGLVLYMAARQIAGALSDAKTKRIEFSPAWLGASALLYSIGMSFFGAFWRRTLIDMGGRLGAVAGLRAYLLSQLGKYVPGKAWVVVLRSMFASELGNSAATAAVATFYETLAMMGVGSLIAAIALAVANGGGKLVTISIGLAAGLLATVQPPFFTRLVSLVALPFRKKGDELARPVQYSTLLRGAYLLAIGWVFAGLSVAAAGQGTGAALFTPAGVLLSIGAMALATAGGFVVIFLPAGLGAREMLLMQALSPVAGPAGAVIAVTVRLVTVVTELAIGGALYLVGRKR